MSPQQSFALVGLPESGKTTFIAAFWHFVSNNDLPCALKLESLEGDWSHLDEIRRKWLDLIELGRTKYEHEQYLGMNLKIGNASGTDDKKCLMTLPDLSGERVRDAWADRFLPGDIVEFFRNARGIVLFLHPLKIVRPVQLRDVKRLANELPGDVAQGVDPAKESEKPRPWDPLMSPTQVIHVDFLQNLISLQRKRWKVSVIISAWDTVAKGISPSGFVKTELPLLHQFITASQDNLEVKMYGVSAQGGDLARDRQKLRDIVDPLERVSVVDDDNISTKDLSLPLRWLLT